MEHAPHGALKKHIRNFIGFTPDHSAVLMKSLLQIVLALHEQAGIAHLDIKPANVLVMRNYRLAITDFGISCKSNKTSTINRGTSNYRAPETYNKGTRINPTKVDAFALGVTFFEIIFGFFPFQSTEESKADNFWKMILEDKWDKFWNSFQKFSRRKLEKEGYAAKIFPFELQNIIQQLLQPDPVKRMSVSEALDCICAYIEYQQQS